MSTSSVNSTALPDRRRIICTLAGAGALGFPALPASAGAADDSALLDLGRRWQAALAAEIAHGKTFHLDMSPDVAAAHDAAGEELHGRVTALLQAITLTPATTAEGLAVKARLLAYEHEVDEPAEASIAEALGKARYIEDRIALSLALDAVRIGRRADA